MSYSYFLLHKCTLFNRIQNLRINVYRNKSSLCKFVHSFQCSSCLYRTRPTNYINVHFRSNKCRNQILLKRYSSTNQQVKQLKKSEVLRLLSLAKPEKWKILVGTLGRPESWKHGGGEEHASEVYSSHGEKGEKGYEGKHGHENGATGYHDKEGHSGHYGEDGGNKKSHHHDDGYYAEHDAGEKGSKGSSFEEHGSFSKGHNTKGGHSVHKLDEAKKNTEFYDEDHDEGFQEKHGGFEEKSGYAKGGHEAGGHYKKVYLEGEHGKGGKYEKGNHHAEEAGHKGASGHDSHYGHGENYGTKGGSEGFKKWGYHH